MAVQESQTEHKPPEGSTPPRRTSTRQKKPQTPGEWMKAHKGLTAVAGVGAGVLLLAHKGGKGGTGGSGAADAAQAAAQEQQAVDNALASAAGTAIPQGSGGLDGGASGSTSGGDTSTDPTPGTLTTLPGQIGPVTINVPGESPSSTPSTKKKAPGKSAEGSNHNKTKKNDKTGKPHNTQKGGHSKPAKGHQGGSGTTVHGKTFPGATGHTIGQTHRNPDGSTSTTVKVHHGGHTDTHTSHNNGKSWTMNTPGHNPPSRGAAHTTPSPPTAKKGRPVAAPHDPHVGGPMAPEHHATPAPVHHNPPPRRPAGRR